MEQHIPQYRVRGQNDRIIGESVDLCRESGWAPDKISRKITAAKEALAHCRELDYRPSSISGRIAFLRGVIQHLEHARQMREAGLSAETTERGLVKKLTGLL